jgi:hypothetical protein
MEGQRAEKYLHRQDLPRHAGTAGGHEPVPPVRLPDLFHQPTAAALRDRGCQAGGAGDLFQTKRRDCRQGRPVEGGKEVPGSVRDHLEADGRTRHQGPQAPGNQGGRATGVGPGVRLGRHQRAKCAGPDRSSAAPAARGEIRCRSCSGSGPWLPVFGPGGVPPKPRGGSATRQSTRVKAAARVREGEALRGPGRGPAGRGLPDPAGGGRPHKMSTSVWAAAVCRGSGKQGGAAV